MEPTDIERIARLIVRDYGLPLRFDKVSLEHAGKCVVEFADAYRRAPSISVGIWCDERVSAYAVRESLKRGLQVND